MTDTPHIKIRCQLLPCVPVQSLSFLFAHVLYTQDMLPYNDYFEYYGPDYRLHMPTSNMENMNKRETLEEVPICFIVYRNGKNYHMYAVLYSLFAAHLKEARRQSLA